MNKEKCGSNGWPYDLDLLCMYEEKLPKLRNLLAESILFFFLLLLA